MSGLGQRANRLSTLAVQLKRPAPARHPYYVRNPFPAGLSAPGWYMRRGGKEVYLGYSFADAEQALRGMLEKQDQARGKKVA